MNRDVFKKLIESIGFIRMGGTYYEYKHFLLILYSSGYHFSCYKVGYGTAWTYYDFQDLKPIEDNLKKELRSIKIKNILN